MAEIKDYYAKVISIATGLDPEAAEADRSDPNHTALKRASKAIWLMSVENVEKGSVAGQAVEMFTWYAAERLIAGTHRKAEPQEIEAELARRDKARLEIQAIEAERKGQALPPSVQTLVATLVANASASLDQRQQRQNKQS